MAPAAQARDWQPLRDKPEVREKALAYLNSDEAQHDLARNLVTMAQQLLNINESSAEVQAKTEWLAEKFEVAFTLYHEVVRRIISTGCQVDRPHRRNWVWDLRIALCVGADHTTRGREIRLVTGDADILRAAHSAGVPDLVMNLEEYLDATGEDD